MRDKPLPKAEAGRQQCSGYNSCRGDTVGVFEIAHKGVLLCVTACDGNVNDTGWDHVSVSTFDRCPTWEEMCYIKRQFFKDNETVLQFHPPTNSYITHEHCLHLWRPIRWNVRMPPPKCV